MKEVCGAFFLMAFFSSILWIPVFGILQAVIDKPWLPNQDMLRDGGSVLLVRKGSRIRGKHDCRIEGLPGVRFAGSHDELIFCLKQADGRTDFVTISREEWGWVKKAGTIVLVSGKMPTERGEWRKIVIH